MEVEVNVPQKFYVNMDEMKVVGLLEIRGKK